ncbi:hypothetical protein BT96DRAFT_768750, partial [Gymnopus androsaceus JB14]
WYDLCASSGVNDISANGLCTELGQIGWGSALLATADPCMQQDIADAMILYAQGPGIQNSDEVISYAIEYCQLPKQAVTVLGIVPSTLYCMTPPVNPELTGIVNAQPSGAHRGIYGSPNVPLVPFGSDGTCPYGSVPDVDTCSC